MGDWFDEFEEGRLADPNGCEERNTGPCWKGEAKAFWLLGLVGGNIDVC
jgi:hypothetical protein